MEQKKAKNVGKNAGLVKTKKKANKPVLCTPFHTQWAPVKEENNAQILSLLKEALTVVNLCPPVINRQLKKEERKKQLEEICAARTEKEKNLRSQVLRGSNSVTRCLERNGLRLCIVDSSSPWQLHSHLIQLCGVRQCVAVSLKGLAKVVEESLGLKHCAVFGFKKLKENDDQSFTEHIEKIISLVPQTSLLPWLQTEEILQSDSTIPEIDATNRIDTSPYLCEEQNHSREEISNHLECIEDLIEDKDDEEETTKTKPPKKDYSYLYITKEEHAKQKRLETFDSDFIKFSNKKSSVEIKCGLEDLVESKRNLSKKRKLQDKKDKKFKKFKKGKYESVNVGRIIPRPDKKQKKNKKKQKS